MNAQTPTPMITPTALQLAAINVRILRFLDYAAGPEGFDAIVEGAQAERKNLRRTLDSMVREALLHHDAEEVTWWKTEAGNLALEAVDVAAGRVQVGGALGDPDDLVLAHSQIIPNPENARARDFTRRPDDEEQTPDRIALDQLKAQIVAAGEVLQNLVVFPADGEGMHMLAAGERRWRAVGELIEEGAWPVDRKLRARLRQPTPGETAFISLVENSQNPLTQLEIARSLKTLMEERSWSAREAALRTGIVDVRTAQQMQQVLRKASADDIAALERGDEGWTWERLRKSVQEPGEAEGPAQVDLEEAVSASGDGPFRFSEVDAAQALAAYRAAGGGNERAVHAPVSGTTTASGETWPASFTEEHVTPYEGYPRAKIYLTVSDKGRWSTATAANAGGPTFAGYSGPKTVWTNDLIFASRAAALDHAAAEVIDHLGDWGKKRKLLRWLVSLGVQPKVQEQDEAEDGQQEAVASSAPSFEEKRKAEIFAICGKLGHAQRLILVEIADKLAFDPDPNHPGWARTASSQPLPMGFHPIFMSIGGGFMYAGADRGNYVSLGKYALEWLRENNWLTSAGDREAILRQARLEGTSTSKILDAEQSGRYVTSWLDPAWEPEPKATPDPDPLSPSQRRMLREIAARSLHRYRLLDNWVQAQPQAIDDPDFQVLWTLAFITRRRDLPGQEFEVALTIAGRDHLKARGQAPQGGLSRNSCTTPWLREATAAATPTGPHVVNGVDYGNATRAAEARRRSGIDPPLPKPHYGSSPSVNPAQPTASYDPKSRPLTELEWLALVELSHKLGAAPEHGGWTRVRKYWLDLIVAPLKADGLIDIDGRKEDGPHGTILGKGILHLLQRDLGIGVSDEELEAVQVEVMDGAPKTARYWTSWLNDDGEPGEAREPGELTEDDVAEAEANGDGDAAELRGRLEEQRAWDDAAPTNADLDDQEELTAELLLDDVRETLGRAHTGAEIRALLSRCGLERPFAGGVQEDVAGSVFDSNAVEAATCDVNRELLDAEAIARAELIAYALNLATQGAPGDPRPPAAGAVDRPEWEVAIRRFTDDAVTYLSQRPAGLRTLEELLQRPPEDTAWDLASAVRAGALSEALLDLAQLRTAIGRPGVDAQKLFAEAFDRFVEFKAQDGGGDQPLLGIYAGDMLNLGSDASDYRVLGINEHGVLKVQRVSRKNGRDYGNPEHVSLARIQSIVSRAKKGA